MVFSGNQGSACFKTKAASRMFPGEMWCDISVKCAFGLKAVMTPFMTATNQSVVPKSVVKVIMLVSDLNSDIDICGHSLISSALVFCAAKGNGRGRTPTIYFFRFHA